MQAIARNFGREGFELAAERHLGIKVNFDFSEIEPETMRTAGVHPARVQGWGRLFREVK